jgi:hypothetical protein
MKATGLRHNAILVVILALAIAPRLYRLTAPEMLDFHSWRQGDSAAFVRGYLQNNLRLLDPRVDRQPCWLADAPFGQVEGELPIPSYLTAIPIWLAGIKVPAPWMIRLASILFFVGACLYLYRLVVRLSGDPTHALASLAVLSLSPLSIFFSRSPQPDGPALMFSAAFLYYLACYLDENRVRDLVLGTFFLAVLLLSKISNLFILLPAFALIVSRVGYLGLLKRWPLFVHLLIALAPAIGWYYYAQRFGWSFGIWGAERGPTKWTDSTVLTTFDVWRVLSERLVFEIVGWPGLILAIFGYLSYAKNPAVKLSFVWAAAMMTFVTATLPAQLTHVYYQLPLITPVSIAAGYGIARFVRRGHGSQLILVVLLAFQLLMSWHRLWGNPDKGFSPYFAEDLGAREGVELTRTHIKDERFVSSDRNPSLFYNSGHQGFFINDYSIAGVLRCLERSRTRYLLVDRQLERYWQNSLRGWQGFTAVMRPLAKGAYYSVYRFRER